MQQRTAMVHLLPRGEARSQRREGRQGGLRPCPRGDLLPLVIFRGKQDPCRSSMSASRLAYASIWSHPWLRLRDTGQLPISRTPRRDGSPTCQLPGHPPRKPQLRVSLVSEKQRWGPEASSFVLTRAGLGDAREPHLWCPCHHRSAPGLADLSHPCWVRTEQGPGAGVLCLPSPVPSACPAVLGAFL